MDQWTVLHKRYKKMRTEIISGRHGLDEPFHLDSADPSSPKGTMKQLCDALQIEIRYKSLVRSLNKKATKLYYKSLSGDALRDAKTERERELARARAARRREKVREILLSQKPTDLK
jgi:hypothetical protein